MNAKRFVLWTILGLFLILNIVVLVRSARRQRAAVETENAYSFPVAPASYSKVVNTTQESVNAGSGYSAIVEMSVLFPAPAGTSDVASRVLLFGHAFLGLRGVVSTKGEPFVVPAWEENHFLIGYDEPTENPQAPKAKLIEYDANTNQTIAEYVHPRGLAHLNIPGKPQQQRSALVRGENNLIWLLTQIVEGSTVRQQVEALDWATKAVRVEQPIPQERTGAVTLIGVGSECLLVYNGSRLTEGTMISPSGNVTNLTLPLQPGESLFCLDSAEDQFCAVTSRRRLMVSNREQVKFVVDIPLEKERRPLCAELIAEENLVVVGAGSTDGNIDTVLFMSTRDGDVERQATLNEPAVDLSYADGHIWTAPYDSSSITAYDRELNVIVPQSRMISVVNVVH